MLKYLKRDSYMKTSSLFLLGLFICTPLLAKIYTLDEAIKTALINNQKQNISAQDRAVAKAKYKQALSANYPKLDITLAANRRDERFIDETDTVFIIPGFGSIPVSYSHTVMGRDTATAQAEVKYALYSGGKISALQEQAKAGIAYADEAAKLTDDEIVLNIRKYYAAVILSQKLQQLMQDTVDRMQATYALTEAFYKGSSMKVKKTDYLRSKMTLLNMESILESFKNATELAKSALAFEMGVGDAKKVEIDASSLPKVSLDATLLEYYRRLYLNNHQLKQVNIGMQAKEAKIAEVKSGYLPMVGLYANAQSLYNNEYGGIINSQNNDSWNIGVAIKYNLFSGGLTNAQMQEAQAQKLKLKAQKAYLESGLELKARNAFLKTKTALKQMEIMKEASEVAKENSDLNFRAYEEEMVDTKDVLESQFMRSLTEAAYYKSQYEALVNSAELEYIIGSSIQ